MPESYTLPDEETFVRYLAMLRAVLVEARSNSHGNPRAAEILDAVENVPDLLCRWPDMKQEIVIGELQHYEQKYLQGAPRFSSILTNGPPDGWQLKWQRDAGR